MKLFSGLISLILVVLALCFALANQQSVVVSLWPFDVAIGVPLYLLSLGTLFVGLLLGAIIAWFAMLPHRFAARRLRKDLKKMHEKIEDLQQTVIAPAPSGITKFFSPKLKKRFWERKT